MPIFKWDGIDLNGAVSSGVDFAVSKIELENLLQQRKIGLMRCRKCRRGIVAGGIKVQLADQVNFFSDLLVLLESGVLLPQALQLFVNQSKKQSLRCVANYLLYQVKNQGIGFDVALNNFKNIFGNLVITGVQSGFYAGNIDTALKNVCGYLRSKLQIKQDLRKAILLPSLTMVLFLVIAIFIFTVIVPQFAGIFESSNVPLEDSTKTVLALSDFLRSWQALIVLVATWLAGLVAYLFTKTVLGQKIVHTLMLYIPLFGRLVYYRNLLNFLQAAALLIDGGVPVVDAFKQANLAINNIVLRRRCSNMIKMVEGGTSINEAMQQADSKFFPNDLITMVMVGEESGRLAFLLNRAAKTYLQKWRSLLQTALALVQPALIILLGVLVALLIFAIYIPIFNLPATMS